MLQPEAELGEWKLNKLEQVTGFEEDFLFKLIQWRISISRSEEEEQAAERWVVNNNVTNGNNGWI